jgi:hypothetical protein
MVGWPNKERPTSVEYFGRNIAAVRPVRTYAIRMRNRTRIMRVNVSWEDVRAGKSMRTSECMVAVALKRELGTEYASVGLRDVRIRMDGRYLTLRLPRKVERKIRFWELFHFAFPFSFEFPGLAIGSGLAEPAVARRESPGKVAVVTTLTSPAVAC